MSNLCFKPTYNPYTEPSMEVFSYHEGLGKWVEIGNSSVFRSEMLRPMGLLEDVSVIAWGLLLKGSRVPTGRVVLELPIGMLDDDQGDFVGTVVCEICKGKKTWPWDRI
ncbi:hypothetical protein SLEP1_g20755 [Rubroshorea leprosula]|uniref:Phenylalanyl-tRNA synthetase domain-containing protein n=1 Tax=Rubroshorea leprosula TaxID=152421 RepID=A0AAV5J933_9ROSI|nr:hypothetical protein SLEP1_g20755 [Rubroshorea leprosula]